MSSFAQDSASGFYPLGMTKKEETLRLRLRVTGKKGDRKGVKEKGSF